MNWTDNLIPLSPFIAIIFVFWFVSVTRRAQDRQRAEMQKELLTKFSSAQELNEFLKSEGGKLFMPAPARRRTPANSAGTGVLVMVVGFGLLAAAKFSSQPELEDNLQIGALLAIAAGIGLLISALITQKLSRKWEERDAQLR